MGDCRAGFQSPTVYENHLGMVKMHSSRIRSQRFCSMINTLGIPSARNLPAPKRQV